MLALLWTVAGAEPVLGADPPRPPKQRAQRLTYDAETGQWHETDRPVPGTEDGDLDTARHFLAIEEYKSASKIIEDWIDTYGTEAPRYPEALYLEGAARMGMGHYRKAHDAFESLLNDYPGSPYAERALSASFRVAEQYMAGERKRIWKGLLKVKDRDAGVEIMDDMIANYPDTPLAELGQKAKADFFYSRGEFELAEDEYATFARQYPRSRYHSYALLQSARAALASFPGIKFDAAALIESEARFRQFSDKYPSKAGQMGVPVMFEEIAARRADKTFEIGKFYEKTGHPDAARFYYRATVDRWPRTAAALQSQARLGEFDTAEENMESEPDLELIDDHSGQEIIE